MRSSAPFRARFVAALLAALAPACGSEFKSTFGEPDGEVSEPPPDGTAGATVTGSGAPGSAGAGAVHGEGGAASAGEGGETGDSGEGGEGGDDEVVVVGAGGVGEPLPLAELIDDVEASFPYLLESGGRNGQWFIADDETWGSISPLEAVALEPPRADSYYAAHVSGSGFTYWGALLGVTFVSPFAAYDASAYCGVRFVAKGHGDSWAVRLPDLKSEPDGGLCGDACYNHLGQHFQPGAEWQEYEIRFDELEHVMSNGEPPRELEASALFAIQFVFESSSGDDFELFVDDLSFVPLAGCL